VATFSRSGSEALSALAAAHPAQLVAENLDITDSPAIGGFIARMASRFGRLDHCIANAAIAHEGVLATMRDDEIDSMLAVNLRGSIIFIRECVRQMLAAKAPADRSITVVSSVVAENGSPGLAVYAATKAALEGFARSLARELGPRGIRVNAIAPGFLETDLSSTLPEEQRARIARRTALGRLGRPEDITGAIDFLTGKSASFSTRFRASKRNSGGRGPSSTAFSPLLVKRTLLSRSSETLRKSRLISVSVGSMSLRLS
jgi:3-oxoacyl-[acyl-carrier protein] reductase